MFTKLLRFGEAVEDDVYDYKNDSLDLPSEDSPIGYNALITMCMKTWCNSAIACAMARSLAMHAFSTVTEEPSDVDEFNSYDVEEMAVVPPK